ncbi:MAG: 5'-nucleotidase [Eubacterium sp.]|nr:5'-nucleotidase [Eubacterium sp.]
MKKQKTIRTKLLISLLFLTLGVGIGIGAPEASAKSMVKKVGYGNNYKMYFGEKEVFEVKQLASSGTLTDGGYYMVEFSIPGTKQVCHLTGLTEANMEEVRDEVIDGYKKGGDFSFTSLDFIDTEKAQIDASGDSELCWAGAAADMLHYAGWGRMAGHDCDDIYDLFAKYFYNEGGFIPNAFAWYFNGVSYGLDSAVRLRELDEEDQPTDPLAPIGGRYLPDYAFDAATEELNVNSMPGGSETGSLLMMNEMEKRFAAGDALGLTVFNEGGGHAITEFGYVVNNKYDKSDLRHYCALIVADSDNDKSTVDDRRTHPNSYTLLRTEAVQGDFVNVDVLNLKDYGFELNGITVLKTPGQVFSESNAAATKNKTTTADFVPSRLRFNNVGPETDDAAIVAVGEEIHTLLGMTNNSEVELRTKLPVRLTVRDAAGKVVQVLDTQVDFDKQNRLYQEMVLDQTIEPLPVGSYRVTVEVNPGKHIKEAYFTNNSYTTELEVRERTFDVSGIGVSAKIGEFGDNETTKAVMSYTGEKTIKKSGWKAWGEMAYYKEGESKDWVTFCSTEFGEGAGVGNYDPVLKKKDTEYNYHALEKEVELNCWGPKVQFRLKIVKEGEPAAYVLSPEYDLIYRKITVKEETGKLSRMKRGATGLNPGEEIVFRLVNESTAEDATVSGKFFAQILDVGEDPIIVVPEMEFTLKKGEESAPIKVTKWGKSISGMQSIDGFLGWDGREPAYYGELVALEIEEVENPLVDIVQDVVDPYDSCVSLREAVAYAQSTGKTVRFSDLVDRSQLVLDKPIEIDGKVSINGYHTVKKHPLVQSLSVISKKKPLFVVKEKGDLTLRGVGVTSRETREVPMIENQGGALTVRQSLFSEIRMDDGDGAMIHSTGGKLKVEKSLFFEGKATNGGAICADGTDTEILNSYFSGNIAKRGAAVYAKGAPCTIVASTIVNNNQYSSSEGDTGDYIVYGDTDLTLIATAFGANRDFMEVGESAKLYGCFLQSSESEVAADTNTVYDDARALFYSNNVDYLMSDYPFGYDTVTDEYPIESLFGNIVTVHKRKGIYIRREEDGTIGISKDGKTYTSTGVKAKFAKNSYAVDLFGKTRGPVFGCQATDYRYADKDLVGSTPIKLSGSVKKGQPYETKLGRVITQGMLYTTEADVALIANGDITGSIKKGDVRAKKVKQIIKSPYQMIELKTLTGEQLKSLFEESIDRMLRAEKKKKNDRNVLQVCGAEIKYVPSKKKGKRIKSVKITGTKLKAKKKYTVAMHATAKTVKAYKVWKAAPVMTMRSCLEDSIQLILSGFENNTRQVANKKHYIESKK